MLRLLLTTVLWGASFLVIAQGVVAAPRAGLLAARALGALLLVALAVSSKGWKRPGRWGDAVVVGGVGVGVFAWLELAHRSQWAPSGATALFMLSTVPVWAALARWARGARVGRTALLASLFVVLGNGIVLANWERPSTLTPFSLFPVADAMLLAAAAAWAAGGVEAEERLAGESTLVRAGTAGLGAAWLLAALPRAVTEVTGSAGAASSAGYLVAIAVVGGVALLLSWHDTISRWGAQAASLACGVAPAVLSGYVFVEAWLGTRRGPIPLVGGAVAAGAAVVLAAGAAGVWGPEEDVGDRGATGEDAVGPGAPWAVIVTRLLALGALVTALVGMVLPSITVAITSHLASDPYAASWKMAGYGTVGGWLALAAVAAGTVAPVRGRRAWVWAILLVASGVGVSVGGYSLWTAWFPWVPVDVHQALGSPYATMTETSLLNPAASAAPWLALATWGFRRRQASPRSL